MPRSNPQLLVDNEVISNVDEPENVIKEKSYTEFMSPETHDPSSHQLDVDDSEIKEDALNKDLAPSPSHSSVVHLAISLPGDTFSDLSPDEIRGFVRASVNDGPLGKPDNREAEELIQNDGFMQRVKTWIKTKYKKFGIPGLMAGLVILGCLLVIPLVLKSL